MQVIDRMYASRGRTKPTQRDLEGNSIAKQREIEAKEIRSGGKSKWEESATKCA